MLYLFLKKIARITVHVFFKKIRINGLENISPGKPMLIAANHTNAFMDAIALQVFAKQNIYTLARSDVFNTPFKKWLLGKIMMHPIYRLQEGADNLHKNAETFETCNKLLKKNQSIMIFPEGICIQQRRLCKLKKGLARIVFGAMESADFKMDMQIVPVGINYSTPSKFGGNLLINIGKPISIANYVAKYQNDKAKTMNQFTNDVENEMEKLIVTISNKAHEEFIERTEKLYKADLISKDKSPRHILEKDFDITRKLTQQVEQKSKTEPEKLQQIIEKTDQYFKAKKTLNLKDWHLKPEKLKNTSKWSALIKSMLLSVTFPVFLFGLIFNYLPFKIPFWLSKKIVKNIEFFTSINLGFGMFLFIFYYLIQTTLVFAVFNSLTMLFLFLLLAPASGLFALNYWRLYQEVKGMTQVIKHNSEVAHLSKQRKEIIKEMDNLFGEQKVE